jgi:hypothetical protein
VALLRAASNPDRMQKMGGAQQLLSRGSLQSLGYSRRWVRLCVLGSGDGASIRSEATPSSSRGQQGKGAIEQQLQQQMTAANGRRGNVDEGVTIDKTPCQVYLWYL